MTSTQPYTVPIISGDLRRAELVKQYADVFEYMDSISQDMFNRIAIRLNVYRAQLNKFDERIQHANAHIERIKGSKRAIQVHSSARYPVEQNRSSYKSIFECDTDKEEHKPPVLHYNPFRLNETVDKFIDPTDKGSKSNDDTLIVLKQYENNFIQKTKRNVVVGLGKPPANIKSVVSFLKYNTQENPYSQPTKIDPLNVGGRTRNKQADDSAKPRISEVPAPDFHKPMSERPSASGLSYNPLLGLVPELSLPDNLPELDNYATFDDNSGVDFSKQQMTSIAPSYVNAMLPDINDLSSNTTTAPPEPPKPTVPAPPPVDIPAIIPLTNSATTAPPSAPPPPPAAPPLPSVLPSVSDDSQASANNPPPPPPPVRSGDDDDDDGGNPLLAEIRNFGKKKALKAAVKTDRLDAAPSPAPRGEQSHMDILITRLQQRRRFINGDAAPSGGEKPVAAPTPPPPAISTGGAMTDAIAAKAKEVAAIKERQKNESDKDSDDTDDEWE